MTKAPTYLRICLKVSRCPVKILTLNIHFYSYPVMILVWGFEWDFFTLKLAKLQSE